MGIFSTLAGSKNKTPEKRSSSPIPDWLTGATVSSSGFSVDSSNMLSLTAVWSIISRISNIIASLPVSIYKNTNDGKEIVKDHPIYKLLHDEPNDYMTAFDYKTIMLTDILKSGASFSEIIFKNGFPIALIPLDPNCVQVINRDGKITYRIEKNGQQVVKQPHELLIIRWWPRIDGTWENPLTKFRDVFGGALAVRQYGNMVFSQGINPAGVISGTNLEELDEPSQQSLIDRFKNYVGLGKSHSLMILSGNEKFERIGIVPEEAQYLESRGFDITEVCRIFNCPPHMVYFLEKQTSFGSGLSDLSQSFVDYTLMPHLIRIEQEVNKKLLDPSFYCKFNPSGLLRGNMTDRITSYEKACRMGLFSINDVLELEDRNDIGSLGETRLVPANMMPLDKMINKDQPKKDNQNE